MRLSVLAHERALSGNLEMRIVIPLSEQLSKAHGRHGHLTESERCGATVNSLNPLKEGDKSQEKINARKCATSIEDIWKIVSNAGFRKVRCDENIPL
ncbi:hypothetical protein TNCV_4409711 [Trichonephila clavipes]|nr:hypothetical protein TNCV_4409711 [Trichonephila clavipes]